MSLSQAPYVARGPNRDLRHFAQPLAKSLGWFSVGLGLAEFLAPKSLCRTLGLEGRERLIRAYGLREAATGLAILMSHDPTPWIWGRVGGDALDLATLGTTSPGVAHHGARRLAGAAVLGVAALDFFCAQSLTARKRLPAPGTFDYSRRTGFPRPPAQMRGAASDLDVPADFRIPEPLRPWRDGGPVPAEAASAL